MMRSITDICLLCQVNPANQTNSHILPKFLSTGFLGPKASRRGYDLTSTTVLKNKATIVQDSPKENYILCEECESYFGLIEVMCSPTFTKWREKIMAGDFSETEAKEGFKVVNCNSSDSNIIKVLIYSIFWRASISSHALFGIKIAADTEDELRTILYSYKASTKDSFLKQFIQKPNLKIFPTLSMTADSFNDETANLIFAPYVPSPYTLVCDRFVFSLYENVSQIQEDSLKPHCNINKQDCKFIVLTPEVWNEAVVKPAFALFAKHSKK